MPGGPCVSSPCPPPVAERERNESQKSFAFDHFDCYLASDQFPYEIGEYDYTSPAKKMSNRAPAPTLPRDLCHETFDPKRSLGLLILVDVALFSPRA